MLVFSRYKAALILGVCLLGIALSIPSLVPSGVLPAWLPRVNLGLDLQGGSYLLLEVDADAIVKDKLASTREQILQIFKEAGIPGDAAIDTHSILVSFPSQNGSAAQTALKNIIEERTDRPRSVPLWASDSQDERLTLTLADDAVKELANDAVVRSIPIVRRRMDETGVNEPVVARQGQGRILVELPGVSDPDRIKKLLGSTAKMTFHLAPPAAGAAERGNRGASLCRYRRRA